ncbi:MAG: OB-fold domain-containing protein [Pseudomonadota bacterium]
MTSSVLRTLPETEKHTEAFWTGGSTGSLLINRCQSCGHYIHPPVPMCPKCHSRDVKPEAVSGRAIVISFTVNYMPWVPDLAVPYIFAAVELEEQPGLRLSTELINIAPEAVAIGMPVKVTFLQQEEIYLPLFEPIDT